MESTRHRAGGLKQSNKPFKSKHSSKGTLKEKSKGKINRVSIKQRGQGPSNKADRRHAARVAQQKKRQEVYETTRVFEGKDGAPKIVAVVPLCDDIDMDLALRNLYQSVEQSVPQGPGPLWMQTERFKHKFQFMPLQRNFIDIMDAMKVADFALFLMSAEVEVDKFGINCLLGVLNQGLVSPIPVVQHLEKTAPKLRTNIKKSLVSFVQQFYPEESRIHTLDNESDAMTVLRMIATQRPRAINWREQHPYLLAENVEFEEHEGEMGTLKVTGVARGAPFNANRLVHLQNYGDFQIDKILSAPLATATRMSDMQEDAAVLDEPKSEDQDDLVSENEPDFMENEQTWPTEEELAEAEERVRHMNGNSNDGSKVTKRVPKGTSVYQAAWIVDEEDAEYSDIDDEDDENMMEDDDEDVEPAGADTEFPSFDDDDEYENLDMNGKENEEEDEFDAVEEDRQLQEYLARQKELKTHTDFPDEIDTPLDIPARTRFARYRGLQSFRTSPWDPYENLPIDYSRIFQYENYNRTKNRVLTQNLVGNVKAKTRVTLYIKDVPKEAYESYSPSRPFVVFGLLQYEHKMTVLNLQITRDNAYEEPVRSKDPMILHMGYRRMVVRPIYSQRGNGKGSNNVHKFERFLQMGKPAVATIYAPTVFGKVPCLLYKENEDDINDPTLVSVGSFMDTDTKRIVAKRIVLSGHPYKIHKRSAVIRFMFFNSEDVHWFKPVQITTKYGRTGHIRESLGTHGYMKVMFDGPITQQDTVMLYLYKRVFPKWNTKLWKGGLNATIVQGGAQKSMDVDAMEE
ncbi:hypothetical protein INT43_001415 [Umbelopsis isabellina]|uniref:Bms1-type G domain-containing protein n=1 Tax=Mortierella isabellina TaxID=91625 RepID=A0A8H7U9Y6_MORIS|nr:hypothetical protein INT43_001415 [Umbelopsis isabellina]